MKNYIPSPRATFAEILLFLVAISLSLAIMLAVTHTVVSHLPPPKKQVSPMPATQTRSEALRF